MSDIENIEIRVMLIGDDYVGKRAIISRFKILNSSATLHNLTDKNEPFFSDKYNANQKKKLLSLIDFSKLLTISNFNLEFKFFPISTADKIEVGDVISEDDELLRANKMKFDNIKSEIEKIMIKPPRIQNAEVKCLFMFVMDLSRFEETFEKLKIYHDTLNKFYNIDQNHAKVLIGNKVDIKDNSINRHVIDEFSMKNRFIYNEISAKMFFNFEKFYEKLFFDTYENDNPGFSTKYFKERFNYVMTYRQTFAKAERSQTKMDNFPGPQQYNSNVYNVENVQPVFNKNRFKNKIFVNKTGPVFNFKRDSLINTTTQTKNNTNEKSHKKNMDKEVKEVKEDFDTAEKKRKLKEEMFGHNPGFTMGIREASVKLRNKRREEYNKRMESFNDIFKLDNIASKKPRRSVSSSRNDYSKRKALKQRIEKKKKKSRQRPDKMANDYTYRTKSENSNNSDEEVTVSKQRTVSSHRNLRVKSNVMDKKQLQEMREKEMIEKAKRDKERREAERMEREIKLKEKMSRKEGPDMYDIRGDILPSKGFTFKSKYDPTYLRNNYGPGYLYLDSDIDIMLKEPKFA